MFGTPAHHSSVEQKFGKFSACKYSWSALTAGASDYVHPLTLSACNCIHLVNHHKLLLNKRYCSAAAAVNKSKAPGHCFTRDRCCYESCKLQAVTNLQC
jgi:hypothetical protein